MHGAGGKNCVFCQIVAGTSPAQWARNDPQSEFVVFHNRLKWERVMLLVVPRRHMTQEELWQSEQLPAAGRLGIEVGDEFCPDSEFRMLSNFGPWAHQSQEHAHIHVISGLAKNLALAKSRGEVIVAESVRFETFDVQRAPTAVGLAPEGAMTQRELWSGTDLLAAAQAAFRHVVHTAHRGFRLASNFSAEDSTPGLFLLGGGQLDLYI